MTNRHLASAARRALTLGALAVLAAGCASANKSAPAAMSASASSSPSMSSSASKTASNSSSMAGMSCSSMPSMSSCSHSSSLPTNTQGVNLNAKGISVDGIRPIPTQLLASTVWQGMKIDAYATTAVPFLVYNGTSMQDVKPSKKTAFHLMVMLSDASTGVAIPYSTVWATIKHAGKVVYDERQYPMISRYMGPHYGNDVDVPISGTYQLSLLVSPPVSARHIEYQHVWMTPHRSNFTFTFTPPPGA